MVVVSCSKYERLCGTSVHFKTVKISGPVFFLPVDEDVLVFRSKTQRWGICVCVCCVVSFFIFSSFCDECA